MPSVTLRRPTRSTRTVAFVLLWLLAGVFSYCNDVTDACPPEVHRREAILHGLIAPLSFAGAARECSLRSDSRFTGVCLDWLSFGLARTNLVHLQGHS